MYVTTFPCHNCAKHIIAAGLRRVVYLEPYPKSRASDLYGEEIVLDPVDGKEVPGKLVFSAFSGIAPRQYRQLFSMSERGAKRGRSLAQWNDEPHVLSPLYIPRSAALLYLATESQSLKKLPTDVYQWDVAGFVRSQRRENRAIRRDRCIRRRADHAGGRGGGGQAWSVGLREGSAVAGREVRPLAAADG